MKIRIKFLYHGEFVIENAPDDFEKYSDADKIALAQEQLRTLSPQDLLQSIWSGHVGSNYLKGELIVSTQGFDSDGAEVAFIENDETKAVLLERKDWRTYVDATESSKLLHPDFDLKSFCSGGVNLDVCDDPKELESFSEVAFSSPELVSRVLFSSVSPQKEIEILKLGLYARKKAEAMRHRRIGDIAPASRLEGHCDRIYDSLSEEVKW